MLIMKAFIYSGIAQKGTVTNFAFKINANLAIFQVPQV